MFLEQIDHESCEFYLTEKVCWQILLNLLLWAKTKLPSLCLKHTVWANWKKQMKLHTEIYIYIYTPSVKINLWTDSYQGNCGFSLAFSENANVSSTWNYLLIRNKSHMSVCTY